MKRNTFFSSEQQIEILKEKRQGLIKAVIILSLILLILLTGTGYSGYHFIKYYAETKSKTVSDTDKLNQKTIELIEKKKEIAEKDSTIEALTKENNEMKEKIEFLEYKINRLNNNTEEEPSTKI